MDIYIKRSAEVFGPYSVDEAREYLSGGALSLSDLARSPGMTEWIPLGSVPGIKRAPPPPFAGARPSPQFLRALETQGKPAYLEALRPPDVRFAGFWIRFAAGIIDALTFGIVAAMVTSFPVVSFLWLGSGGVRSDSDVAIVHVIMSISITVAWWLYTATLLSSRWQATFGMKACGLQIVNERGARISFGRATGRYFAQSIAGLLTLGIGFLMIGWTERKQGLHDLIARTLVMML